MTFLVDPKELKARKKQRTKEPKTQVEVKIDQAVRDWILKEAPIRQEKIAQEVIRSSTCSLMVAACFEKES